MPHQCTDCGRTFDDGSKAMLGGCPNCGGNTFQFRPDGAPADQPEEPPDPPEPAVDGVARTVGNAATAVRDLVGGSPSRGSSSNQSAEDDAQASARSDFVPSEHLPSSPSRDRSTSNWSPSDADGRTPPGPPGARTDSDAASDSTRTDTDVSDTTGSPSDTADDARAETGAETDVGDGSADTRSTDTPTDADADDSSRPELSELREELNDQFESIRVLEPGQYELNLMELYDREEYIIALQEDGKYTIQVPERWNE